MNPVIILIILGVIAWLVNCLFGLMQIKDFNKNYIELRRIGKVAIGRKKGYIRAGTVVLILIDEEGTVISSRKMQGVSVFARVKEFKGLEGMSLSNITKEKLKGFNKLMRIAILDATKIYNTFKGGEDEKSHDEKEIDKQLVV
ncbi:transcriptional regulator GutM [Clostridium lacusfryxellense]|uniref:transcriptional regulator GutM n=1 Tax=Clostridium lacusfryxellense TaxID=205328 RepID=UPI001C0DABAD|nr:transcriptional regulator GutM [Clostridium lacusfryxellense]MBU3112225.1 transcriptional regulator GutM [Clostridium lacusfryxellense]